MMYLHALYRVQYSYIPPKGVVKTRKFRMIFKHFSILHMFNVEHCGGEPAQAATMASCRLSFTLVMS